MTRALRLLPLAGLLAGCAAASRGATPRSSLDVPEAWSAAVDPASIDPATIDPTSRVEQPAEADDGAWWHSLGGPELDLLVAEALSANRDLALGAARMRQAEATARIAAGGRLPTLGLDARGGRQKQIFVGLPVPGGDVLESQSTSYGVSLDLAWELDLWGRLSSEARAAHRDLEASQSDLAAARLSIAGQTVKVWLAWQEARLQGDFARRVLESYVHTAEVVERRFGEASASALEVRLAEANVAGARAQIELRGEEAARAVRQLELLLGRYPAGALEAPLGLPPTPPAPPLGVPGELIARRPDLAASEERLRAADERLHAARASLYPRLSLAGSVGRTSNTLSDLFDPAFSIWSIAAGLAQPIFQGGRLRAGVDLADARVAEALADFEASLLRALGEVESALVSEGFLARLEVEQTQASQASAAAARLAEERYEAGLERLLVVLESQRRAFEAESRLLSVHRQRLAQRVDLHLSLGGGFEPQSQTRPESP